jgi:hypothetical protein
MKIDKFFRKQSKALAGAAQLPDDAQASLDAGAKPVHKKDGDATKAYQNFEKTDAVDAGDSMDIDQVGSKQQQGQSGLFLYIMGPASAYPSLIHCSKGVLAIICKWQVSYEPPRATCRCTS